MSGEKARETQGQHRTRGSGPSAVRAAIALTGKRKGAQNPIERLKDEHEARERGPQAEELRLERGR
jgi:hypothetical protein